MKKLLSIFAATSVVATTSATVVACGNVASLSFEAEKKDADVVSNLSDYIAEKKLKADMKDLTLPTEIKGEPTITNKGKMDGKDVAYIGLDSSLEKNKALFALFKQSKDLKASESTDKLTVTEYYFSLKGDKDATSFELFLGKFEKKYTEEKKAVTFTYTSINKKTIKIAQ
ncbi:hypothetical protein SCHIN_v1c10220 [Spiroplasma chinense]|uniref:Lipoprotein n=1 Tax=Spiroplasma chinense TaxID=216932 RepID=A0A5B9Y5V8_9MOLU|nr:lipoprotein [Spiroplasma chinense]QEH62215.1 hypothetical protein SCHIN_v1c10220 [Spiroplasma chinense]